MMRFHPIEDVNLLRYNLSQRQYFIVLTWSLLLQNIREMSDLGSSFFQFEIRTEFMNSKRQGTVNERENGNIIESSVPKDTVVNKQSHWRQFSEFCGAKNCKIDVTMTIPESAMIFLDYVLNVRRRDGTHYKECIIKTLWNERAKRNIFEET